MLNPLRNRRAAVADEAIADAVRPAADAVRNCRWCGSWHVRNASLWSDAWAQAWSDDHRAGSRPNWARQALISGLVFGDEGMHGLDELSEKEFVGLFEAAERYIARARRHHSGADFFIVYVNGGPKSGGSVEHAHAQIVGRDDCHFAYPELVAARCPPDYWRRVQVAHRQLGLAVASGECVAWASLAPVKERDLTANSANIADGARFVYRCWKALAGRGTRNFSLAAVISPAYFVGHRCPERFARWPSVLWRFVDRGDPEVRHGDIGTMELFGSAVVANDPFDVAQWLAPSFPASGGG